MRGDPPMNRHAERGGKARTYFKATLKGLKEATDARATCEPPRMAVWLLQQWASPYQRESLLGDLLEMYRAGRSRLWYWRQVLAALILGRVRALRSFQGASFGTALLRRRRAASNTREPLPIQYARSLFPVISIVMLIRSFVVEPFRIPSASMMPGLVDGDFILVNKFSYALRLPVVNSKILSTGHPQRGDVVVFRLPSDPSVPTSNA
jgi:signal peptidase S26 family